MILTSAVGIHSRVWALSEHTAGHAAEVLGFHDLGQVYGRYQRRFAESVALFAADRCDRAERHCGVLIGSTTGAVTPY